MTSTIKVNTVKDTASTDIIKKCGTSITVGTASDTTTVAGNAVRSNAFQASDGANIVSQVGTTITLGATGDNIVLAGGATQSGFGRTGTVDWQTGSIKTATFTAANGEGYFANTSGGAFTINLPAGSAGAIISIADYTRTFATNNLTVAANGSEKIGGVAQTLPLNINGQSLTLIYVDGTEGWINVQNAEDTETGLTPAFIAASGGNSCAVSGDFKYHIFTGPGTFTVSNAGNANGSNSVSYLVLAGGGGGGGSAATPNDAGTSGAGAGGYREGLGLNDSYTGSPLRAPTGVPIINTGGYSVTVGAGGAGTSSSAAGSKGSNSSFSSITSAGGGGGGGFAVPEGQACRPVAVLQGGSGGGGGTYQNSPGQTGSGTGNQPPVSPPQGNDGGNGTGGRGGAGGGGAGAVGTNGSPVNAGAGGNGVASEITASPVTRGGGGGGASMPGSAAPGGTGGGGNGSNTPGGSSAGTVNTGGGGAGGGKTCANNSADGKAGGSGVVIIRYKFQ